MADIRNRMLLHHLRGAPTAHIEHLSKGEVTHSGAGQSFWFRPLSLVLTPDLLAPVLARLGGRP